MGLPRHPHLRHRAVRAAARLSARPAEIAAGLYRILSRFPPVRLALRLCAAACLLAAALVLLLTAGAAEAQTPTSEKLVGNTGIANGRSFRNSRSN